MEGIVNHDDSDDFFDSAGLWDWLDYYVYARIRRILPVRRVLRDIRNLAADLATRRMRDEADRVLGISAQLPTITRPERIQGFRWELLAIQDTLREKGLTNTQDALSIVLSQLRAIEHNLKG